MQNCPVCQFKADHNPNSDACRLSAIADTLVKKAILLEQKQHIDFVEQNNHPFVLTRSSNQALYTTPETARRVIRARMLGLNVHRSPLSGVGVIKARRLAQGGGQILVREHAAEYEGQNAFNKAAGDIDEVADSFPKKRVYKLTDDEGPTTRKQVFYRRLFAPDLIPTGRKLESNEVNRAIDAFKTPGRIESFLYSNSGGLVGVGGEDASDADIGDALIASSAAKNI